MTLYQDNNYVVRLSFNDLGVLKRRVKFDNFNTCEGFESAQIIVTVNALPWNVELTEPVHIVTSDISFPRPSI